MENPSLQIGDNNWAVKDGSILGYNIIQDNYLPQPIDFTRASTATRVNAAGLIEGVRTNLILQSNTFNTTWTNTSTTETSGQSGYDGTNNAWLLEKSGVNGRIQQSIVSSGLQTYSVYLKAGSSNWVFLLLTTNIGDQAAYFNLTNGDIGVGTRLDAKSEDVGNGWWRCSVIFNATTSSARIYVADGNGNLSGISGSIYIQDAQLETGDIATEYIPTTTAAVSVGMLANIPRIDYTGGGFGKLLLEPQRTNLALYSEQFDNAAWSEANATVSQNQAVSPDGTQNADLILTSTTSSIQKYAIQTRSISVGSYTASFFVKANTYGSVAVVSLIGGTINISYFNITSGTKGTTSAGTTSTIEDYGNGWYRITQTATETTSASRLVGIYFANSALNSITYSGSLSDSFYIWGASLEAGSYVSSYVPTTSTAVTRLADAASKTGISSLINSTEGVLFVEISSLTTTESGIERYVSISNGSTSNSIRLGFNGNTNAIYARIFISGTAYTPIINTSSTITNFNKLAVKWKVDDFALWINGVEIASVTTSANIFGSGQLTDIKFNRGDGAESFYGKVQNLMVFPSALSDTELATLTTL